MARDYDLRLVARHPGGRVAMRFHGQEGSHVDLVMLTPPLAAVDRKLVVKEISGWHAPTRTRIGRSDDPRLDIKTGFLLLMIVNIRKESVLDILGPGARSAEWWTDVDDTLPQRRG
ncbi:hypothetical protein [uncultured Jannaschia sp.]|uniref:hypothetical protein n=1 Tax=uncultured Jannaschia sp. TaxID=293347 RepID=UPI002605F01D|nr:hypothetical protein [uncultured Jannaschia sp.]